MLAAPEDASVLAEIALECLQRRWQLLWKTPLRPLSRPCAVAPRSSSVAGLEPNDKFP
jgi:hypothetical protein